MIYILNFKRHEDKDAFGCDPFAILHAPTRPSSAPPPQRPESPTPALPPKKGKQPPPRPAPPRPALYNTVASHNSSSTSSEFADFTNFNSKVIYLHFNVYIFAFPFLISYFILSNFIAKFL